MNTIYTQIGLLMDVVGIIILFFFGPPISESLGLIKSRLDHDKNKSKAKNELRMSFLGLTYLLLGFVMQFIGSIK